MATSTQQEIQAFLAEMGQEGEHWSSTTEGEGVTGWYLLLPETSGVVPLTEEITGPFSRLRTYLLASIMKASHGGWIFTVAAGDSHAASRVGTDPKWMRGFAPIGVFETKDSQKPLSVAFREFLDHYIPSLQAGFGIRSTEK